MRQSQTDEIRHVQTCGKKRKPNKMTLKNRGRPIRLVNINTTPGDAQKKKKERVKFTTLYHGGGGVPIIIPSTTKYTFR